jgi:hypothetical protein
VGGFCKLMNTILEHSVERVADDVCLKEQLVVFYAPSFGRSLDGHVKGLASGAVAAEERDEVFGIGKEGLPIRFTGEPPSASAPGGRELFSALGGNANREVGHGIVSLDGDAILCVESRAHCNIIPSIAETHSRSKGGPYQDDRFCLSDQKARHALFKPVSRTGLSKARHCRVLMDLGA